MSLSQVILDTDILSALMRQEPAVSVRAKAYLAQHNLFTFSIITRYEVLRGLKAKSAGRKAATFDIFCSRNRILPLTEDAIVRAAEIYAELYKRGELIGDADILISATALVNGPGVATNNERHFGRITGLHVGNWHK